MTERNNQASTVRPNERASRRAIDMRSVAQSRMKIVQGSEQGTCSPSAVRSIAPRKTCLFNTFQSFLRHLLLGISFLRRKQKSDGLEQSQSPPLKGFELGGWSSTTLSLETSPRPSMREHCLSLGGDFGSQGKSPQRRLKCEIFSRSPPTPHAWRRDSQNGKNNCRWKGNIVDAGHGIVTRKIKGGKDLKRTTRGARHGDNTIRADGYVDNSPLRSELTTYPQPLKERLAHTGKAISSWVTHKPPPPDLCFAILHRRLVDIPSIGRLKTRRN